MRQTISGLLAAIAITASSAVPASACGGLFGGGCSPCGYVSPCAPVYVQPYWGCYGCGAAFEVLPDPELQYQTAPVALPQYYYVNQGPTYTGPGDFAPYPYYEEGGLTGWGGYYHRRHYGYWHHRYYKHHYRYGSRQHVLRSYY